LVAFDVDRAAATAMAERHADGALPVEDFNIEVEDQSGQKVRLGSETDQRCVARVSVCVWDFRFELECEGLCSVAGQ